MSTSAPRHRQSLLEAAIQALPVGVVVHDERGLCILANDAARALGSRAIDDLSASAFDSPDAAIIAEIVDDIVLTPERDIERAVSLLVQIEKSVVEGAGAAGLEAMLTHPDRFRGRHVGLVLCGGNIDLELFRRWVLG